MENSSTNLLACEEGMNEYTVRISGKLVSVNYFEKKKIIVLHCWLVVVLASF